MQLEHTDVIQAPLETVYKLVKYELPKIAQYLPSIKKIEKLEEKELANSRTKIVNHWYGQAELPSMVKSVLKDDFFSWKDTAIWDDVKMCVDYELESFFANDLFEAKGKNYFTSLDSGESQLRITCNVNIHPDKIPGVPTFMVKKLLPTIEKIIEKMLQPNLTSLGQGLKAYLAKNP